jgi:hypothetical protein
MLARKWPKGDRELAASRPGRNRGELALGGRARRPLLRCASGAHGGCCCGLLLVEVKYGAQGDVDLHEFVWVQAAGEVAQALRVD